MLDSPAAIFALASHTLASLPGALDVAPTLREELLRVITLSDYNTRLVVLSTAMLGAASGLIGTFLLLRKRALMSDALSHSTLPGIAIAFMIIVSLGGTGKSLIGLLVGATAFGLLGVASVLFIRRFSRLHDDAALGIVLSVFFGFGVALLGLIQDMPQASAAGLESFIYGKTASMVQHDLVLIAGASAIVTLLCVLFRREFTLLCFDDDFAATQRLPVLVFDVLLLALVTAVTVTGLQAVGLILIIALLIIPAASARFWTDRIGVMLVLASLFGAVCGWIGSSISALAPKLPSGAIIVLSGSTLFLFSMFFGTARGAIVRGVRAIQVRREVGRQNLLRGLYELKFGDPEARFGAPVPHVDDLPKTPAAREGADRVASPRRSRPAPNNMPAVSFRDLLDRRSWGPLGLRLLILRARWRGLVEPAAASGREASTGDRRYRLTPRGAEEAERVVRNHRLWEAFLLRYADIAPSHVDRAADQIEHVLGTELVAELERELQQPDGAGPPRRGHRDVVEAEVPS